ncbi:hypothetical protein Ct9H90mP29_17350 [bacterium]|nr:MAG: hypothetical protein Ct9H90mP29_17350 [bacterium]
MEVANELHAKMDEVSKDAEPSFKFRAFSESRLILQYISVEINMVTKILSYMNLLSKYIEDLIRKTSRFHIL